MFRLVPHTSICLSVPVVLHMVLQQVTVLYVLCVPVICLGQQTWMWAQQLLVLQEYVGCSASSVALLVGMAVL